MFPMSAEFWWVLTFVNIVHIVECLRVTWTFSTISTLAMSIIIMNIVISFTTLWKIDTFNNEIPTSNSDDSNWFTATGKGTLFFSSGKKIVDSSYYFTTHYGNIARDTRISKLISLIMLGHSSKKSIDFEILEELE